MSIQSISLLILLSTGATYSSQNENLTNSEKDEMSNLESNSKFFAFLFYADNLKFYRCGGAIVDKDWIITAQSCLKSTFARRFCIRNFHNSSEICNWIEFQSIQMDTVNVDERYIRDTDEHNLAFGKIPTAFSAHKGIPICSDQYAGRNSRLQSCGMQWLGSDFEHYSNKIKSVNYKEVGNADPALIHVVRDNVNNSDDNNCVRNAGDPLYIMDGNTSKPLCLYGVSTGMIN
ncbi:uncharacterized protein LOC142348031 [Convolutriloba macropyga]|uniref:uncharacterized protein LOC142348031 n=1 Tax=Convolutriloba macropyga TaxID=536237 RepID=UPI003F51F29C